MSKLISFDLWDTLVKSNPQFAEVRISLVSGYTTKSKEEVKNTFKDVKNSFDALVEKYGVQFDHYMLYDIVFDKLNVLVGQGSERIGLIKMINDFFIQYPPIIYSDDTINCIKNLKIKGYPLVLISNTLFIEGNVINKAIQKIGLRDYFDDVVYSSNNDISKPHPRIFEYAYENFKYDKKDIIHVGDNIRTDLYGATQYGVEGYLINNTKTSTQFKNKTITDFVNYLEQTHEK